jgi:hypothetical protein
MGGMKRTHAAAVLLAASLLPGCYFLSKVVPTDASGMEYPARLAAETVREQVHNTGASITGLPAAIARHFRECWRNMTHNPSDL